MRAVVIGNLMVIVVIVAIISYFSPGIDVASMLFGAVIALALLAATG